MVLVVSALRDTGVFYVRKVITLSFPWQLSNIYSFVLTFTFFVFLIDFLNVNIVKQKQYDLLDVTILLVDLLLFKLISSMNHTLGVSFSYMYIMENFKKTIKTSLIKRVCINYRIHASGLSLICSTFSRIKSVPFTAL